jgi:hypothetical protein
MHSPAPIVSRASEAAHQILPDETSAKIRGILATFAADVTASLFVVAEGEELDSNRLHVSQSNSESLAAPDS